MMSVPGVAIVADTAQRAADWGFHFRNEGLRAFERTYDSPTIENQAVTVLFAPAESNGALAWLRRWRIDQKNLLIWAPLGAEKADVSPGWAAGADFCLPGPVTPGPLVAAVRAALRIQGIMNQADHDREARQLANRAVLLEHDRSTRDERLVQQIHLNGLPKRIPAIGPYYFMLTGSDGWFDVVALDETRLAFWIAQPGGLGSLTGKILGLAIRQSVTETLLKQRAHAINPSQLLEAVNAQLVSFDTNPVPMVGLGVGVLDTTSGEICFARGGIPTAMIRSGATGAARPWSDPGVFLGGFDAVFSQQQLTLNPGDTLELSTGPAGTPGNTQLVLTRRGDR